VEKNLFEFVTADLTYLGGDIFWRLPYIRIK